MRTWLAPALALLSACITNRLGPGVLRQDWNERRRDDPMVNPAETYPDNRWTDEPPERIPGPGETPQGAAGDGEEQAPAEGDSPGVDLTKRSIATALAVFAGGQGRALRGMAGWLPILESSGTFEEDPTTRHLERQRLQRAHRRRADQHRRRIERAPAAP
ncbi:MAG TPA: hypothetical protein VHE35_35510 [Kofleriaceae bacterium]|nr:hypothetical protein [Kofleriaceae bacterium]